MNQCKHSQNSKNCLQVDWCHQSREPSISSNEQLSTTSEVLSGSDSSSHPTEIPTFNQTKSFQRVVTFPKTQHKVFDYCPTRHHPSQEVKRSPSKQQFRKSRYECEGLIKHEIEQLTLKHVERFDAAQHSLFQHETTERCLIEAACTEWHLSVNGIPVPCKVKAVLAKDDPMQSVLQNEMEKQIIANSGTPLNTPHCDPNYSQQHHVRIAQRMYEESLMPAQFTGKLAKISLPLLQQQPEFESRPSGSLKVWLSFEFDKTQNSDISQINQHFVNSCFNLQINGICHGKQVLSQNAKYQFSGKNTIKAIQERLVALRSYICQKIIAEKRSKYSEHSNPKLVLRSIQSKRHNSHVTLNRANKVHFFVRDTQNKTIYARIRGGQLTNIDNILTGFNQIVVSQFALESITLSLNIPTVKQENTIDPVMDSQAKPWDLLTEYKKLKATEKIQTINLFQSLIDIANQRATLQSQISEKVLYPHTNLDRLIFALKTDWDEKTPFVKMFDRVSVFGLHVLFTDPGTHKSEVVTFLPTLSSIYLVCLTSPNKSKVIVDYNEDEPVYQRVPLHLRLQQLLPKDIQGQPKSQSHICIMWTSLRTSLACNFLQISSIVSKKLIGLVPIRIENGVFEFLTQTNSQFSKCGILESEKKQSRQLLNQLIDDGIDFLTEHGVESYDFKISVADAPKHRLI